MNLDHIRARLTEKQFGDLARVVAQLEAAIAAGAVRNVLLADAKFIINRRIEDAVRSFDDAHGRGYDVLIMGAYNVPAALKEATKKKMPARVEFLTALLPLNDLLQAAKPLIVKRKPGVVTAKQAQRLADAMTCQCCARPIFANTGAIAHHGYQRPGTGWQTNSCMGAKALPFEVSRDRLGDQIETLKRHKATLTKGREDTAAETRPVYFYYTLNSAPRDRMGHRQEGSVAITRDTFEAAKIEKDVATSLAQRSIYRFDDLKKREVADFDYKIKATADHIAHDQARFDGWTQTHERRGNEWVKL